MYECPRREGYLYDLQPDWRFRQLLARLSLRQGKGREA
jgi:hypothetical protein